MQPQLRRATAFFRPRPWVLVLWIMIALIVVAPDDLPFVDRLFDELSWAYPLVAPFLVFAYLSMIGFIFFEHSTASLGLGYVFPFLVYLFVLLSMIDVLARASAGVLARWLVAVLRSRAMARAA
jgi:hypothetical protein